MIPSFPAFKPLELVDRAPLEALLGQLSPLASEYTFTNLFAWEESAHYAIARFADGFMIRKMADDGPVLLQPLVLADPMGAVQQGLGYLAAESASPRFERVGEDFLARLPEAGSPVEARAERDHFDYLYDVQELIELKGEKYHDKKNLLNQFVNRVPYRYLPLEPEMIGRALLLGHTWCDERDCEQNEGLLQELCAIFRMLTHFRALNAVGGAIEVEGRLVALTLGERTSDETFVIHAEKALGSMTGLYQAINWEFLRHAASGYRYVNREQDLGLPGLRKAKLSYNPVRLVKKYTLTPRG